MIVNACDCPGGDWQEIAIALDGGWDALGYQRLPRHWQIGAPGLVRGIFAHIQQLVKC